jgi:peptidoglycan/xylan/chitin deacetylase (PgdA/CDA1 family)
MNLFVKCIALIILATAIAYGITGFQSAATVHQPVENIVLDSPMVSFTFDDGSTWDAPGYSAVKWNQMILHHLRKHNLKAVFFVAGSGMKHKAGLEVLNQWNNEGHWIANHTFTHPNFENPKISPQDYEKEILKNDSMLRSFRNFHKLFRFPYLKEGNTSEKRNYIRKVLADHHYRNGHVTIDGADSYIHHRMRQRLASQPNASLDDFRKFYLDHILDRSKYYDSMALAMTGRRIPHTLLLHHTLSSGLFLGELINAYKKRGWKLIDAPKAYQDPIFKIEPDIVPAGQSLIWAMAKATGKFDSLLRSPAESRDYEKDKMDALGL